MSAESEPTEKIKTIECQNFNEGLIALRNLAKSTHERANRLILIVVTGKPNSGKTKLIKEFLSRDNDFNQNGQPKAKKAMGFQAVSEYKIKNSLPSKFLLVEDVSNPDSIQINASKLGLSVDIYVYLINPNNSNDATDFGTFPPDLIIKNPESQIKQVYARN